MVKLRCKNAKLFLSEPLSQNTTRFIFVEQKPMERLGMIGRAKKDFESAVKYGPKYASAARLVLEKPLTGRSDF